MSVLVGLMIVASAVALGYSLEGGQFRVLVQPAELLIILGAALGAMLLGNPLRNVRALARGLAGLLKQAEYPKDLYLDSMRLLQDLFLLGQMSGSTKLESEVEEPESSKILQAYPAFAQKPHLVTFLCDTLRLFLFSGCKPDDLSELLSAEADSRQDERQEPARVLASMGDSMPGLGIVAAVLGIIVTMGGLNGPREIIGEHVAASLTGTFLGILISYGFLMPLAAKLDKRNQEEAHFYKFLRAGVGAYTRGFSPRVSVELARRSIPPRLRPDFHEFERLRRVRA